MHQHTNLNDGMHTIAEMTSGVIHLAMKCGSCDFFWQFISHTLVHLHTKNCSSSSFSLGYLAVDTKADMIAKSIPIKANSNCIRSSLTLQQNIQWRPQSVTWLVYMSSTSVTTHSMTQNVEHLCVLSICYLKVQEVPKTTAII